VLIAVITLVVLAAVILVISAPLRVARREAEPQEPDRAELETAREAKYREIRDLELDYRTGKLSEQDYQATDGALRAEALQILDRIERLQASDPS
jgi:hypothetical protein